VLAGGELLLELMIWEQSSQQEANIFDRWHVRSFKETSTAHLSNAQKPSS
jgi:hypothetical protein